MSDPAPSAADLEAYRLGRLPLAQFERVDAWLAAQPSDVLDRLLDGAETGPDRLADATRSGALLPASPAAGGLVAAGPPGEAPPGYDLRSPFAAAGGPPRYRVLSRIGAGGMGIVEVLEDTVLDRAVALKRCRPRGTQEDLASHAARVRAFRREAAITAQLEHPAIVPVHDVGFGALGEPAFIMKRLEGEPLSALLARHPFPNAMDVPRMVDVLLRVAEAIAYAHERGIIHRDLKPDNVIVGTLGAVSVIDWGLARHIGVPAVPAASAAPTAPADQPAPSAPPAPGPDAASAARPAARRRDPSLTTPSCDLRQGTPAWMAPEQGVAGAASPREDVFALGGLIMVCLTGCGPRQPLHRSGVAAGETGITRLPPAPGGIDLRPLERPGLPIGLVAVARRCLAVDPEERYRHGGEVAAELQRWLRAGLTLAQRPSAFSRLWTAARRSPRLGATLCGGGLVLLAVLIVLGIGRWRGHRLEEARARAAVAAIDASVDIADPDSVVAAQAQLDYLMRDHPDLVEAHDMRARLRAAQEVIAAGRREHQRQDRFLALAEDYRQMGPWSGEEDALVSALADAGLLQAEPGGPVLRGTRAAAAARLRGDPLIADILPCLVLMEVACRTAPDADGHGAAWRDLADQLPAIIATAGPDAAWRAIGRLLGQVRIEPGGAIPRAGPDLDAALARPATCDQLLAIALPTPRLIAAAAARRVEDPGAFWACLLAARGSLGERDWMSAERDALVALGREPRSLWPHLILAYCGLGRGDATLLHREADAAHQINPELQEATLLDAVALAQGGQGIAAQNLIDQRLDAAYLGWYARQAEPYRTCLAALTDAHVRLSQIQTQPMPRPAAPGAR